jgi:hypothetical protein
MNQLNHIPDELFNLVESKAWQMLSEVEKQKVLKYLTEEEYNSLHFTFNETKIYFHDHKNIKAPESLSVNLERKFNNHHKKNYMVPLWQVAAILVVMFGTFLYVLKNQNTIEKQIVNTIHDTLYVPQIAEADKKETDTIIIYKYITVPNNYHKNKSGKLNATSTSILNASTKEVREPLIRTLSPDEIKNCIKNKNSKSMFEDTLYHKIGYASI